MIEFAIEKYPIQTRLTNGLECLIRPLQASDESAYNEFYQAVPEEERAFFKHRITDGSMFHEWRGVPDYESHLPLMAFAGDQLIGDMTLHQRPGGWKRHIGLVSLVTHPEFRNIGLVDVLIEEIVEIAKHAGLTKLEAEFNGERIQAIKGLALVGFGELTRIPNYVEDAKANSHDYVLMGMDLISPEELMTAGD